MNDLAKQLIEKNLQTKDPYLDLGNCGLTNHSPCLDLLAECTHLETLIFSEIWHEWNPGALDYFEATSTNKGRQNKFRGIPVNLPTSLNKLVLRENSIDRIENIAHLTNLQYLDLEENDIEVIENLDHLARLEYLNLRGNAIEKIGNLNALTQLVHLELSSNSLERVENLNHLKHLQNLDLRENNIKKIENLAGLTALTRLDLGYNGFGKIEGLHNLPRLKQLELEENDIKKIENLHHLPQLKSLNLRFNSFEKLENLDALTELTELSLGYNGISKIEGLEKLTKLKMLGLMFNRVTKLENLDTLTELEKLWMNHTGIKKIENLDKLTKLTHLSLMCSKVTKIENLEALTQLTSLSLHATKISKIENLEALTNLTKLRVDGNKVAKIENLDNLTQLDDLMLGGNPISKIENLGHLIKLRKLDLGGLAITKIENLEGLRTLEQLDLGGSQIETIENLEGLTGLQKLELRATKVSKIENLNHLPALTELDLSETAITKIEGLTGLEGLKELSLSKNKITKIENLAGLSKLEKLSLCASNLSKIENLTGLPKLRELCLEKNAIECLENLRGLPALKELDLNNNQITHIQPNALPTQLAELNLSQNQLIKVEHLAGVTGLTELDLSENNISKIENFEDLPALETLDLSYNKITRLENLTALPNLREVNIYQNQITEIATDAVTRQLQELDLEQNQISTIEILVNFTGLSQVDVGNNQIKWFPIELLDLPCLTSLRLKNNPWQNIPVAITEGYHALQNIRRYWQDLEQGKSLIYQAKLLLVGNGRVGKTSLVRRWLDNAFDPDQSSTHAIQLRQHILPQVAQDEALEHVQLNVWDFGGQDIYHTTHRLFMQTQAVFLLAWDAATQATPEQTEKLGDGSEVIYKNYPLLYWLDYAYILGKQSPVLVVQTKCDRDGVQAPPQLTDDLKTHYQVQQCLAVDAAVDDAAKNGFKELNIALQNVLAQGIQRTCTDLPESWWHTQQALEKLQKEGKQMLSIVGFESLCAEHQVPKASYKVLQSYFHNSGVFFYRPGLFNDQIILNQQWAIDAVYTLFDRTGMFMQHRGNGFFTGADLGLVWQDKPKAEQELLLSFMEACELCIDLNRPRNKKAPRYIAPLFKREYLAPQLLPNTTPAEQGALFPAGATGVYLKFCHPVLHAAVMHRFILRTHHFASRDNIQQQAILLEVAGTQALVEAFPDKNELTIRLNKENSTLLSQIRNELSEIQEGISGIGEWASIDGQGYVAMEELWQNQHSPQVMGDNGQAYAVTAFEVFFGLDKVAFLGEDAPPQKL
ncbi:leucine-rich repeat protein [Microscilla marina]|uniref:Leucine-rich protein n=1 Tax=Microscilla marina ATCC 23134 TaxID=313606 RepID=A1ZCX6_MICM2|nr:leucine-rich repeat protein [Microscilla marina]EAY31515.1 leucine-rich protein [Microscilla marina ATCC 23134]